jgi:drug/metabolite transporter (DMT)-like permease
VLDKHPGQAGVRWFAQRDLSPNLVASLLLIAAFVTFTAMGMLARVAAAEVPVVVIVLLRQMFATLMMMPVFIAGRHAILHPTGLRLHLLRGASAAGAMIFGLSAVVSIPFADATAIQMAEVLFITALAATVLGERVGWRRWLATAVGFAGVLVMLRPFSGGFDPLALFALAAGMFGAVTVISLRLGAQHDSISTVLFYQGLVVMALVAPLALWVWVTPSWWTLGVIGAMSCIFMLGQWLFTSAMRKGEASALAPLNYLRLLLMSVVGYFAYGEVPTWATVAGAVLVVGAASYTIHRNAIRQSPQPDKATTT